MQCRFYWGLCWDRMPLLMKMELMTGTYDRLNYLLIKEFHLKRIDFTETEIPIDEISAEKLLVGEKNFKQWFDAIPCDKEDLDIYTWDVIGQYIKK